VAYALLKITVFILPIVFAALSPMRNPDNPWRCFCQIPSLDSAYAMSTNVFFGEVTNCELLTDSIMGQYRLATIQIQQVWKGSSDTLITIWTQPGDADCGFPFVVADYYLVFAQPVGRKGLYTSHCFRTMPAVYAMKDTAALNAKYGHRRD